VFDSDLYNSSFVARVQQVINTAKRKGCTMYRLSLTSPKDTSHPVDDLDDTSRSNIIERC